MKKYLMLTASYGTGHNAAASAIKNFLVEKGDEVKTIDLTELLKKGGDNTKKFYAFTEKVPFIWDATFNLLDQEFANEILEIVLKSIYQKTFNEIVKEFAPDYVICTFPNWPVFIKNYCKIYDKTFKTGVVITDAIEIGMPWYYGEEIIDNYFVIDKWSKEFCKNKFNHKGLINRINISFFPIEKEYFRDKKKIGNEKIIILLTGIKKPFILKFLELIKKEEFYREILIIKGRNDVLYKLIKSSNKSPKIKFTEFIKIKEILKDYDLFLAKPGGTIMCECIAQDVPLISSSFIPGQEEGNIKLMTKESIGIFETNPEKIVFYMKYLDWNKFLPNFKKIKNPDAVEYIIKKIES